MDSEAFVLAPRQYTACKVMHSHFGWMYQAESHDDKHGFDGTRIAGSMDGRGIQQDSFHAEGLKSAESVVTRWSTRFVMGHVQGPAGVGSIERRVVIGGAERVLCARMDFFSRGSRCWRARCTLHRRHCLESCCWTVVQYSDHQQVANNSQCFLCDPQICSPLVSCCRLRAVWLTGIWQSWLGLSHS